MDYTALISLAVMLAVLGLSIWNRKRNAMGIPASVLLIALCVLTNVMVVIWNAYVVVLPYPQSTRLLPFYATPFPIFDALGLAVCGWMINKQRSWWCGLLFLTFLASEAIHYNFWKSRPDTMSYYATIAAVREYSDKLNWLAWTQSAIVAFPGGWGLGSLVGRAIADSAGRSRPLANRPSVIRKVAKEP